MRATLGWGAFAAGAALAWGTLVERRLFSVRHVRVPLLPPGSQEVRVLHLSDLHMAPWQRKKQTWVRELVRLSPDFIVNTGDNLGHKDGLDGIVQAFEGFRGIPGVFVNGSNDYFEPVPINPLKYFSGPSQSRKKSGQLNTGALEAYFGDLGWTNINDGVAAINVKGVPFEFLGVNDPHHGFDRLDVLAEAVDDARSLGRRDLRGKETHEEHDVLGLTFPITVGVAHAPYRRILDTFVDYGAELIFAGHTHGGQVCIPGFGALVTNCDIPRGQVKGLSSWHRGERAAWLHVSAGLGTSIYAPIRFACRPEVTLLRLVPSRR